MAFPTTGVLDDFNRADGPLGANWTNTYSGTPGLIVSNQLDPDGSSYWNVLTATESEAFIDVVTFDAGGPTFGMTLRTVNPGATPSYYLVRLFTGPAMQFFRNNAETFTQLGSNTNITFNDGDSFGAAVEGSGSSVVITAYRKPSGGQWALLDSRTDTDANRLVAPGFIGFRVDIPSTWIADNFGGGEVITSGPADDPPIGILGRGAGW